MGWVAGAQQDFLHKCKLRPVTLFLRCKSHKGLIISSCSTVIEFKRITKKHTLGKREICSRFALHHTLGLPAFPKEKGTELSSQL